MKRRAIIGITAFVLTLSVMIPVVFFLTRGTVSLNQFGVITAGVLFLVLWTIPYAMLVDPLLRRTVGALFNTTIEWQRAGKSMSWTAAAETGCIASLFIDLLGYFFVVLWFVPIAAAIGLVLWFRH
jgi:hypothetical protein